jgi:CheY-like chemotaxis protein
MAANPRRLEVLLVEDNPTDVLLTRDILEKNQVSMNLHVVEDGVKALAFLRRQGEFAAAPRPDLVLLDLNLPRKSGWEVLADMKTDDQLKVIPVVVLTSSKAEADIDRAYSCHANCYVTKAVDYEGFAEVLRSLKHFWLNVATLPSG